jgi:hypothetical protein
LWAGWITKDVGQVGAVDEAFGEEFSFLIGLKHSKGITGEAEVFQPSPKPRAKSVNLQAFPPVVTNLSQSYHFTISETSLIFYWIAL